MCNAICIDCGMVTSAQLKEARRQLGESQEVFGLRFGVDQATIHRWETNAIPTRGAARKAIERFFEEVEREAAE